MSLKNGSLMRLFQSEFFDAHLHMHYLLRMEQQGVQDYLVNELYKMTDDDVDFYLPQLVQIALLRYKISSLHRFILDKAASSMHFALKTYWLAQSIVEDRTPELSEYAKEMVDACETAMEKGTTHLEPSATEAAERLASARAARRAASGAIMKHLEMLTRSSTPEEKAQSLGLPSCMPNAYIELGGTMPKASAFADEDNANVIGTRQCDFFHTQNQLMEMVKKLTEELANITEKPERVTALSNVLNVLNHWLLERRLCVGLSQIGHRGLLGLHIPMLRNRDSRQQIVRVCVDQCKIFSSATRAPFLLVYETANLDEEIVSDPLASCLALEMGADNTDASVSEGNAGESSLTWQLLQKRLEEIDGRNFTAALTSGVTKACGECPDASLPSKQEDDHDDNTSAGECQGDSTQKIRQRRKEEAQKARLFIWGEMWDDRIARTRRTSPYGGLRSWALNAIVLKGSDDLRQELLAAQIVKTFMTIWKEARLPLWMHQMEVLVTSSSTGILECITDAISVDTMKKRFPGKSLAEIFRLSFADRIFEAKKNFIESCAAYSLLVWFMQVKDRHNGNLMMDLNGHMIHVDFGFMLSNSPGGNIHFEQSPFKLTQEFLDLMDGESSDQYEYFRTLVIRGFLELRKHMERVILPVHMMLSGSKMPCFREGADAILQSLHERFFVNLTEEACIEKIVDLIDASVNNWSTRQYDNYQRIVNGIL
eukprot:gnl/TRDRNA2_/TRDRNA2_82874_c0_seq1.p1 gnl/TRDRNA2_/TRDRNA2_82874_c0~~gnl/TRDRNA2_/TRDRNA2_82874_c0_seq1.p1  ORF type:complete len:711 (-),score=143.33 gnl/TRDRNA2_/TRDRNA2_82874_c0_seq1:128-2260(-)